MSDLVPEGWSSATLSDLVVLQYGKSPKDVMIDGGEYPIIGTGGVTGYASDYLHDGHTTVIGRKGTINRPSFILNKFWAIDTTYIATDYKEADPKWFYYGLNNIDLTKYNEASGVPSLNRDTLYAIPFKCPPLPEQQKIAAILSSVDEVIEKTQAQIKKLKDLKTGMMQELLSPREGQAANINNPQGESKNSLHHIEFKDSPLGRIPVGWETLPLENLVHRIIDCEHKTAPYIDKSEFLVVRTSNVRHGELVHKDMKFTTESGFSEWTKRAIPSVGDVLFTREAPAGESCMVPEGIKVCMGQRMVLLRPNKDLVEPNYFSLFLTSEFAELSIYELSIGTTVNRINIEDIKKIPYIIPPKSEQKKICSIVQSIQKTLTTKQSKLKSLLDTKKALMQDLLTGKVRVTVD